LKGSANLQSNNNVHVLYLMYNLMVAQDEK